MGEGYNATSLSDLWEWKADFTKIYSRHNISMGGDVNRSAFISPLNGASASYSTFQTSNLESSVGGNAMVSFLLGVPDSGGERNVLEREHGGWVNGVYFQDQWRPTDRLTLNIGVRYDYTLFPIYGKGPSDPDSLVGDLDLNNGTYIMTYNAPSCIVNGQPPEPTESGYAGGEPFSRRGSSTGTDSFPPGTVVHGPADPESLCLAVEFRHSAFAGPEHRSNRQLCRRYRPSPGRRHLFERCCNPRPWGRGRRDRSPALYVHHSHLL